MGPLIFGDCAVGYFEASLILAMSTEDCRILGDYCRFQKFYYDFLSEIDDPNYEKIKEKWELMDGLPFSICHRNPVMGSKGIIAKPLSFCKISVYSV